MTLVVGEPGPAGRCRNGWGRPGHDEMHLTTVSHDAPSGGDDDGLVARARAGDEVAFGELVRTQRRAALRVATVVLGTAEGADDVVQDATERAWRAMDGFRPGLAFRPWLLRIVANGARNERRSRGRRAGLALRATASSATEATGPTPEDAAVSAAERQRVVDALNRLGPDDRLVIGLRFFEQMSEQEMSVVIGRPAGTVKSRLARAKARLRAELEGDGRG
jgi:RNA polymerase sigma factor (sigma-70 family)